MPTPPGPVTSAARGGEVVPITGYLTIEGTSFRTADGQPFLWRGVTAFSLLAQLAAGDSAAVDRYLTWAANEHLTVLRVLSMAKHLFDLSPQAGRRHLGDLLTRAAARGLYVEIVALADTAEIAVPLDEQVRAIGEIAARHPNAIVELANEPYHATQRSEVNDLEALSALLALVPDPVPVAVGAPDEPGRIVAGDFITHHFPRSSGAGGWGHVRDLIIGRDLLARVRKPVINDEPVGAGAVTVPGRRDAEPARFETAALLTRMIGMGATFHYEGGLQTRIPEGRELECFRAWQAAWRHLPSDIEASGVFRLPGEPGAAIVRVDGAGLGAWEVQQGDSVWVLIARPAGDRAVRWAEHWRETGSTAIGAGQAELKRGARRQR